MGNMQAQLQQLAVWWLLATVVATIASMWMAYLVIKLAVRDGIKESGLVEALARSKAPPQRQGLDLPEMRADR